MCPSFPSNRKAQQFLKVESISGMRWRRSVCINTIKRRKTYNILLKCLDVLESNNNENGTDNDRLEESWRKTLNIELKKSMIYDGVVFATQVSCCYVTFQDWIIS